MAASISADPTPCCGAEVIADAFVRHQLTRVFVYPGGTIAPILELMDGRGIDVFCSRHEQGAGYAALAAARLSGRPQVVMVTSGPGVTNLVTAVADAYFDSVPLVVLTGQVGTADLRAPRALRQRGFQEIDATAVLAPITKAQLCPMTPNDVAAAIETAFLRASDGRPGPVVVDLPMDVQRGAISVTPVVVTRPPTTPSLDAATVARAARLIAAAERPVIIAGQGVILARAHGELRRLATAGGIPVSHSLLSMGAMPSDSPLSLGFHGHTGNQVAGLAIHNADVLLVVGSRLDVRQTGTKPDAFAPSAHVIRIDIDDTELDHSRVEASVVLRADAAPALRAITDAIGRTSPPPARREWLMRIARWRLEHPLAPGPGTRLKPQHVIATLDRLTAGEEVICVSGVGSHQQWTARHFTFDYPRRTWLTSGGHGAMGFDLPTAIGAQRARPDCRVLCCVGDGSLQMNIQELASLVTYELPVKIVVLDNHRLGIVSQFQRLNWGRDPACGEKWNPDFAAIARAYGLLAETVTDAGGLEIALRRALSSQGPALVHCIVDPDEDISPMLLAGQTIDAMWTRA
jgi:acetolactate synthase I/II/III large subunit